MSERFEETVRGGCVEAPAVAPGEPVKHQVHHSYIWLGSMRIALIIVFSVAVSMGASLAGILADVGLGGSSGDRGAVLIVLVICALSVVVLLAIVAVYQTFSYKHLWYEFGDEELSLYSGIFNKKRVHVPYRRIQSVDQRASLIQRIFGVCTVSIDTAGGSNNKAVQIPYVQKAKAEELRAELFMRKARSAADFGQGLQGAAAQQAPDLSDASGDKRNVLDLPAGLWEDVRGVFAGDAVDTGRVSYEYGLTNKELVLTGLSNNTVFVLIIIGVLAAVAQLASELLPLLIDDMSPVVGVAVSMSLRLFGGEIIAFIIVSVVGTIALVWLLSVIGTCISYGGFRCCRRDNRIEVERGLLQHQFQGVNVDRVQSVSVKQTFIRRLFGYCEVSIGKVAAAQDGADAQQTASLQQGLVIHPFVKMDRVPEILAGIIPEFAGVPSDVRPVPPIAKRRAIIRRAVIWGTGFWLAILTAATHIAFHVVAGSPSADLASDAAAVLPTVNMVAGILYAVSVALLVLDVVGALLWHKDSGFAFNREFVQISNGGFSRETVSFPRRKVQFGWTRANPLQRRAHTASVQVRTAAGVGGTTVRLIDADEQDAMEWLAWLKPHGNVVE